MAKGSRGGKRGTSAGATSRGNGKYVMVDGEKVYNSPPDGFKKSVGGSYGIDLYNNGKSFFGGERVTVKVKSKEFEEYYSKSGKPTKKLENIRTQKAAKAKAEEEERNLVNRMRENKKQEREAERKRRERNNLIKEEERRQKNEEDSLRTVLGGGVYKGSIFK